MVVLRLSILTSVCLVASGCSFKNPAFDDTETESQTIGFSSSDTSPPDSDSESTATTEAPTTEAPTTETPTTEAPTTEAPTTETDTLNTTIDEPSETGEETIEPSGSESETTSTTGDSTSTDTDDTDIIDDLCMPPFNGENALDLNVVQLPNNEQVRGPCELDPPGALAKVTWEGNQMLLSICDDDCGNCDDFPDLAIEMYAPNEELLPNNDTLNSGTCVWFQFDTNKPSGNKCTASSLVLLDYPSNKPRFVMIDDQWNRPSGLPFSLNWSTFLAPECIACDDCCGDETPPGTYAFEFLPPNFDMAPTVFPGDVLDIEFFGHAGTIAAYDALMTIDCKPHVEFILNTY